MNLWEKCLAILRSELPPTDFNTWILPLQAIDEDNTLRLFAPNQFVKDWVEGRYLETIVQVCGDSRSGSSRKVRVEVGSAPRSSLASAAPVAPTENTNEPVDYDRRVAESNLNPDFNFDTFVEGKSNQIARAASIQVGENPGKVYNPLFIYGGVGLGKTHLMHAVGNAILGTNPSARVIYLHSDRFVGDMVKAMQHNRIDEFKRRYRSVNALLIDDVQFFAGKERTQEEFFHTFNVLFESQQQIVLSSDRFPKEVSGLEERLKSRFGWGLTVAIDPPDLETRVAILQKKALQLGTLVPDDVAFFVGKRIRSNIRDLEGALRRLIANSKFTGREISLEFAKDALRDILAAQDKQVTLENIQKTVAEYFQIRTSELLSSKRNRSVARPRQVAMALAKELTKHSLPEIGEAFGGRDHTTVLHATRRVQELRNADARVADDYRNLVRILTN